MKLGFTATVRYGLKVTAVTSVAVDHYPQACLLEVER
jgi:hypothetical protein